jgi:hypothetical protein
MVACYRESSWGVSNRTPLLTKVATMLSPAWLLPGLAWVRALIYGERPLVTSER